MKVWHIVMGRPIGPTFLVYLTKPTIEPNPHDMYGTWAEETTLDEVMERFLKSPYPDSTVLEIRMRDTHGI